MISIIMPVYNTADYLNNSIKNVINQSLTDWELICIDDGSCDNSFQILSKYAADDKRIRVIHQEHLGAGPARNAGIDLACGEYIIFLDSDDEYKTDFLSNLYNAATSFDADICICNIANEADGVICYLDKSSNIPEGPFSFSELGDSGFFDCRNMVWNKLIKRKIVTDNNIRFQNLTSSNDVYFSCKALLSSERIYHLPGKSDMVHRNNRVGQISENRNPNNLLSCAKQLVDEHFNQQFEKDNNSSLQILKPCDIIRKIIELLLRGSLEELRRASDDKVRAAYYDNLRAYILENEELFDNCSSVQSIIKQLFLTNTLEETWWKEDKLLAAQLESSADELKSLIHGVKKPVVWGIGKRGLAFLHFCLRNNISIYAVTDRSISKAMDYLNSSIISIKTIDNKSALNDSELIIATNSIIYKYLSDNGFTNVINLEHYCPIL
ncbi:glycosyltransferase family 2 protein [Butyrivibrio sp. MC2013]|uniref:glycosyltransferase family 2 protein n=1 Tax=Butyrivibrio sp. MC2013 TaxID=1280686 RepID=UPI00040517D7|nr:glycosyltransferase family 2 protein [Butyrivibrio sp. MC2013]